MYDFGIKMYAAQPRIAFLVNKAILGSAFLSRRAVTGWSYTKSYTFRYFDNKLKSGVWEYL